MRVFTLFTQSKKVEIYKCLIIVCISRIENDLASYFLYSFQVLLFLLSDGVVTDLATLLNDSYNVDDIDQHHVFLVNIKSIQLVEHQHSLV